MGSCLTWIVGCLPCEAAMNSSAWFFSWKKLMVAPISYSAPWLKSVRGSDWSHFTAHRLG